jgi:phosphoglucosamine mutase
MKSKGVRLSKLIHCWTRFPQVLINIRVREKVPFEKLDGVTALLTEAEAKLKAEGGRILLRYSGTEPKARLLLEGRDAAVLNDWGKRIRDAIQKEIGAGISGAS